MDKAGPYFVTITHVIESYMSKTSLQMMAFSVFLETLSMESQEYQIFA